MAHLITTPYNNLMLWDLIMHWEVLLSQSQWGFITVSWALNRLMWHCIDEERDDKSFMGIERVSWG
jgi:hypothetical protein